MMDSCQVIYRVAHLRGTIPDSLAPLWGPGPIDIYPLGSGSLRVGSNSSAPGGTHNVQKLPARRASSETCSPQRPKGAEAATFVLDVG